MNFLKRQLQMLEFTVIRFHCKLVGFGKVFFNLLGGKNRRFVEKTIVDVSLTEITTVDIDSITLWKISLDG